MNTPYRSGTPRARVLIIGHDTIGPKMAGPALRQWELAHVLARELDVTLAAPGTPAREPDGFRLAGYRRADAASLAGLIGESDVIVTYLTMLRELPVLANAGRPLAFDLYIPHMLEALEQWECAGRPLDEQQRELDGLIGALGGELRAGDFFVCGSERQRRFWLGALTAAGRVNPATFDDDPSLRRLIDVLPFGLGSAPEPRRRVLKGVWPGIGADDRVVLWGSGIWNWFDPLTIIRAVAALVPARPELKLFFVARSHFDASVLPEQAMARQAVDLAGALGLLDRHVFFGNWIPYDERGDYLLEADLGVSLHFDHLETHFAERTRLYDFLWAGLPMVVTGGDVVSERVAAARLGRVVAAGDVEGVAAAIAALLDTPGLKAQLAPQFAALRAELSWERVARPLLAFCRAPRLAADAASRAAEPPGAQFVPVPPPWWRLPQRAAEYLRAGGPGYLRQGMAMYWRWLRESLAARRPPGAGGAGR
jgi:glycosyltransferase involved in cell wall biosynthesis